MAFFFWPGEWLGYRRAICAFSLKLKIQFPPPRGFWWSARWRESLILALGLPRMLAGCSPNCVYPDTNFEVVNAGVVRDQFQRPFCLSSRRLPQKAKSDIW